MYKNMAMAMDLEFERKKNTRAALITAGVAGLLMLIMFLWKWPIHELTKPLPDEGIMVELNLPDEPEVPQYAAVSGGGGGGNPVQAAGDPGLAPHTPPVPGVDEDVKDLDEDETEKESPPIIKPDNPKPKAKEINKNTNPVKVPEPKKEVVTPPQPKPNPKAVLGKTTGGTGTGGNNAATTYDRAGGSGTGSGIGNGSGTGGGTGTGSGGGNGRGGGRGTGPRRVSGNRSVISPKNMDAGENLRGKVLARIKVSPDGVGTYISAERGSTYTSGEAVNIIKEWLRRNKFNATAEESVVVYEFNFLLGG